MSAQHSWMTVRVARRTEAAQDIIVLDLVHPVGADLPSYSAGSHIDVEVEPGMVRQYSLCNNGKDRARYVIAVLRDPQSRGGSTAIHDRFTEGTLIRIGEPRNHFPLRETNGTALLIGGGIGVTPLLCMAERLSFADAAFHLHYCTRAPERTAFRKEILRSRFADKVTFHFDSDGDAGLFDPLTAFASLSPHDHAYVCGPPGFIDWISAAAESARWPVERLHREYFAAAPATGERDDVGFDVKIASTGEVVAVAPDERVAEALVRIGIEVPISCDQGVCGTCVTRVIEGSPDHRDLLGLSGDGEFTPCCSRSKSPLLVLDL